jgi:hypothetical protein
MKWSEKKMEKYNCYKGFVKIFKDGMPVNSFFEKDGMKAEFAIEDNCIIINENLVIPMHNVCYFNINKNDNNSDHNYHLLIMVANWANL